MKRKNEKGFTMVELLAVVVIIGIIGTIGVVGVRKVIDSSHQKYEQSQTKLFVLAAQTYFTDNKSKLPTKTFTQSKVTLKELIEANYIDKIVDYKKEAYDEEKSYAYVTKMATGKYAYDGELLRQNGEATKYKTDKNINSTIQFTLDGSSFGESSTKQYTNNVKTIKITMKDPDIIAGYIISIYKNGYRSEDLEYKEVGNATEVSTNINLTKEALKDGEYSLQVKVIDIYNNQYTLKSGTVVIDTTPPKCEILLSGTKGSNDWYKEKAVDVTVKITEKNPSKYNLTTSSTPSYTTAYTNSSDNTFTSPIKKQSDTSGITYYGYAKDKVGNVGQCSKKFKVDTIAPTCKLTSDNNWHSSAVTIKFTSKTDETNGSSLAAYGMSDTATVVYNSKEEFSYNQNTSGTVYGYVKDNAGNAGKCSSAVKMDKTVPKTTTTNSHSGWKGKTYVNADKYKLGVETTNIGSSGIAKIERSIDGNWETIVSDCSQVPSANGSCSNYLTNAWKTQRNSSICYRAISGSGVAGTYNCVTVQIDTTPPTLTIKHRYLDNMVYAYCNDTGGSGPSTQYKAIYDPINPSAFKQQKCSTSSDNYLCHYYEDCTTDDTKNTPFTCIDNAGNYSTRQASLKVRCACSEVTGKVRECRADGESSSNNTVIATFP